MAKTQYSLSTDPGLVGRPKNFDVPLRDVMVSAGAGFVVVLTGDIMTMPGLPKVPAAETIDIDARRPDRRALLRTSGQWPVVVNLSEWMQIVGWVDGHRAQHGRRAPPIPSKTVVGLAPLDPPYKDSQPLSG